MSNLCNQCDKWAEAKKSALEKSDSIFDAYQDIIGFEESCVKTCPYMNNSKENS